MPIICFEGASAVGKTTLSAFLRDNYNAYVIPEVNLLFERKNNEAKFWYFEKQIERWQLAVSAARNHEIIILDGDPFQPLWYNWSYDFDFGEPFEEIMDFYERNLATGRIDFPEKYFILNVRTDELRKRKADDVSRTRKNFERHLRFIQPQLAYFNFIKSIDNNLVKFIKNKEIESAGREIIDSIKENSSSNKPSSLLLFHSIKNWLENNTPEKFKS
jgi:hypothetical protein